MATPRPPGKHAEENIAKLQEKLRELFQLDRGDLDFGLYRIMAFKRREVDAFLKNDLLPQVTEALQGIAQSDTASLEAELKKTIKTAKDLGHDPETTPKVKELKNKLKAAKHDQQTEADTYNHLCNFFARYYDEGDFMSLRRYKSGGKEAYSIPYNGEEVKLHWANSDQYYIKTTENYASYGFTVGDGARRVRFEISAADNEKDNIKADNGKQRFFVLSKNSVAVDAGELVIRFEHRPLSDGEKIKFPQNGIKRQAAINDDIETRLLKKTASDWATPLAAACPTPSNGERTLLGKHLTAYTAKNSFDYFIHKDLGGFLRRELDAYIKNEVISIDNLQLTDDPEVWQRGFAQVRAVKKVGGKIIDFLAQLEDFQKQLWLKKKFVLETNYCVTLDRVPETMYADIAKNKAQHDEWVKLFAIDEIKGDTVNGNINYGKKLTAEFLKANRYLALDTRHFERDFQDQLLAALAEAGPIDGQMNGLLVHGENFQALNLMHERYRGGVQCIHIDPPYNTDTSGFIYKNNYRHSSWMTMMENRVGCSLRLLSVDGAFFCHIDEHEYERLRLLMNNMNLLNAGTIVWDKRNPMTGGSGVATQHEYIICGLVSDQTINLPSRNIEVMLKKARQIIEQNGGVTKNAQQQYVDWARNNNKLSGGEKAYLLDEEGRVYRDVSLRAPEPRTDKKFFKPLIHPVTGKPCPVPPNGFSRTPETLQAMIKKGEIIFGVDETTQPRQKRLLLSGAKNQITSIMQEARRGKADILKLGLDEFPYSHSVHFYAELIGAGTEAGSGNILDYFAGSGTTGHAVINLNREDDGERKYILVELGNHFENVMLPRMKKVIYSRDWKDGKPKHRDGVSQLFKYIRLECYEDALDSIKPESRNDLVEQMKRKDFIEDYKLRYALGEETAKSTTLAGKDFQDPFNHTLRVVRDGVRCDANVDLAETFNFLLGLRVADRRRLDDVLAITGANAKGENCLILWRNLKQINADKLDKWFAKHRKIFGDDLNLIYVNGDHTLNALAGKGDKWQAVTIEPVFRELMFANMVRKNG